MTRDELEKLLSNMYHISGVEDTDNACEVILLEFDRLNGFCLWVADYDYESDIWETGCGESFVFEDDGPIENGFKFCPYCGMAIKTGES